MNWIAFTMLSIGALLSLLASVGVLRLPDLYMRMQAATKASTLGVAMAVAGVAMHYGSMVIAVEAMLVVFFLFLTAPIAAHLIARAAYVVGVRVWEQTVADELREGLAETGDEEPQVSSDEDRPPMPIRDRGSSPPGTEV